MTAHSSSIVASSQGRDAAAALLGWYDAHHRDLPWRVSPAARAAGVRPDPYRVWLSEIMLQQTTVEAVKPYFTKFLAIWPGVADLAAAEADDVMKAWAGLGYYSRARNLKKCAEIVASEHDGRFPENETTLRTLPGVGQYTAAAIAAIAFDRPAAVVDGNVERVVTRLAAISTPLPEAKAEIRLHVQAMLPTERPGDFAQAMMDLGATICTPKRPKCMLCPLNDHCLALRDGDPEHYPVKAPKAARPLRRGAAFIAVRDDGAILLRKRQERGLLGGMAEPPTSGWTARQDGETGTDAAPFAADWRRAGSISHVFTHFELHLDVFRADGVEHQAPVGCWWSPAADILGEALPSVMKKAIEAAIPGITKQSPGSEKAQMSEIRHIVFDIGKVLIHYDPELPYKRLIPDAERRAWFLGNVCTGEWNVEQDRGRTWAKAEELLLASHPDHEDMIRGFRLNWHEMVPHAYDDSVAILERLVGAGHDVTMLTNFAADTFVEARQRYPFLNLGRGVTVSGEVGMIKPDERIYRLHADNFDLDAPATLFIDDSAKNVEGARKAGWQAVLFTDAAQLERDLERLGIAA